MDFKKLTREVMKAISTSKEVTQIDSSDAEPTFESDTKSTFDLNTYDDHSDRVIGRCKPAGEWEVKVTLEMTYKKYDDE